MLQRETFYHAFESLTIIFDPLLAFPAENLRIFIATFSEISDHYLSNNTEINDSFTLIL